MATWTFTTPTVDEAPAGVGPLFSRVQIARGVTVLETAGAYSAVRYPVNDEIEAATTAYVGGHEYTVDDDTKAALIAAGVGVSESNFTAQ